MSFQETEDWTAFIDSAWLINTGLRQYMNWVLLFIIFIIIKYIYNAMLSEFGIKHVIKCGILWVMLLFQMHVINDSQLAG